MSNETEDVYLYKNESQEFSQKEEAPNGDVPEKKEKPINPNSFMPVIDDMYELFGQIFFDNKMEIIKDNREIFDCTLLGVLFSAGWGSPCRIFNKDLIDVYNKMKKKKKILRLFKSHSIKPKIISKNQLLVCLGSFYRLISKELKI